MTIRIYLGIYWTYLKVLQSVESGINLLIGLFLDNSEAWGYRPLGYDRDVYEPLPNSGYEPFQLHLIGDGHLDIPKALSNVIYIHNGLNYTDFYAFMQSMDVVIPAFVNMDCALL